MPEATTTQPVTGKVLASRFSATHAAPAEASVVAPAPRGDLTAAGIEAVETVVLDTWPGGRAAQRRRARGARLLLEHLGGFAGPTWQERWQSSGLDEPGRPVGAVASKPRQRDELSVGAACVFSLRIVRPSLLALLSTVTRFLGYGERFLAAQNDPLLDDFWARVQEVAVQPVHHVGALFDVTAALTTQGIALAGLTPEALLHYVWESRDHGLNFKSRATNNRGQFPGHLAWQVLHTMGQFPAATPSTLRAALLTGPMTIDQLVDRYPIRHHGVRQLLIDYLGRRQPELDYSSLEQLTRRLAGLFWANLETLAPGQGDLRLDADLYQRWRDALARRNDGGRRVEVERILLSVRSFYIDVCTWAVDEPEQWAHWVAPCPIPASALRGFNVRQRRTKERMDDRVRQRQPLLPALVAHLEDRYGHLRALLRHATDLPGGHSFTVGGRSYRRIWTPADQRRLHRGGHANTRVRDVADGTDINVTTAEDKAFWEWATVEVLRHTGVRVEELLELSHLSVRQYQRPNGEVIALLVVAPSKTDRERVLPISAELLAVIAAIVRRHTHTGATIPLIARYDHHERQMSEPLPYLFQRQLGAIRGVISTATVLAMLRRRCADLAAHHPGFKGATFTPHDFRRLFATDLVNNGLPIHIGAALLGHLNLQTTRGYVAVFNEDVVRHYQHFLDRRRTGRPADEYRPVTDTEWDGFEQHFDRRKVELGNCGRPYGTPCAHEHACVRCPMLQVNPKMLSRLDELEADLVQRHAQAENEGWLGETEGIDLTLSSLRAKREETRRRHNLTTASTQLAMPTIKR